MTKTHVAIQGVCAWPNLIQFPDGTIIATIFNQPTHGGWEGDLDCWASTDGGEIWSFRGKPAPHDPTTTRMNCAAGLARDGSMIVMSSGWSNRLPAGTYRDPHKGEVLPLWVCHSDDGAKTWQHVEGAAQPPPGPPHTLIPFGKIIQNYDNTLGVSLYGWGADPKQREALFYISHDDGRTWELRSTIAQDLNETTLLALPNGKLLAAARTAGDKHLELFSSDDAGTTWQAKGPLSLPSQIPADMIRIADGRIVLCYGNRCPNAFGIDTRISQNNGETWGPPARLANRPLSDGGYPSSVQRTDGQIVTAYYNKLSGKDHFEMCVVTWDVNDYDRIK